MSWKPRQPKRKPTFPVKGQRAVRAYLEAIRDQTETADLRKRLADIEEQSFTALPIVRYMLMEEAQTVRAKLAERTKELADEVEADFILYARDYARYYHITYKAFRELGVPQRVLRTAGIYPGAKMKR